MHTHEISFDRIDEHGGPDAAAEAEAEGQDHLDSLTWWVVDEDPDSPDTRPFKALRIPATGPDGYAL